MDDGSSDNTPRICDRWANIDSRVRAIHQKNQGVSAARNTGIDIARGKYICFIDSDDVVDQSYISALMEMHAKHKADLTISGLIMTYKAEDEIFQVPETVFECSEFQKLFSLLNYQFLLRGPYCKLFNSDIIRSNCLKFDRTIHFGEDSIFVLQYCLLIERIAFSSDVSYHYFRRPTGIVCAKCHRRDSVNEIKAFSRIFNEWATRFGVPYYNVPYFYDTVGIIYSRFCGGLTDGYNWGEFIDLYVHIDATVFERLFPPKTKKAKLYQKMLRYTPRILGALEYVMKK